MLSPSDEETTWSTQIIPHSYYARLERLLWPSAVFSALKDGTVSLYRLQSGSIKSALGVELKEEDKQILRIKEKIRKQREARAELESLRAKLDKQVSNSNAEQLGSQPGSPAHSGPEQDLRFEKSEGWIFNIKVLRIPVPRMTVPEDVRLSSAKFLGSLFGNLEKSKVGEHSEGCCLLSGELEITGTKARCKAHVAALYNPGTGEIWTYIVGQQFWPHIIKPKGGP